VLSKPPASKGHDAKKADVPGFIQLNINYVNIETLAQGVVWDRKSREMAEKPEIPSSFQTPGTACPISLAPGGDQGFGGIDLSRIVIRRLIPT
jgi:hypothetical protein